VCYSRQIAPLRARGPAPSGRTGATYADPGSGAARAESKPSERVDMVQILPVRSQKLLGIQISILRSVAVGAPSSFMECAEHRDGKLGFSVAKTGAAQSLAVECRRVFMGGASIFAERVNFQPALTQ
jgi:hypothetical protein